MEEIVFPILEHYTSTEGQEVFEEIMQLTTLITYVTPAISPRLWTLFPRRVLVGAGVGGGAGVWGRGARVLGGGAARGGGCWD